MNQETWTCSACGLNELSDKLISCLCGIVRKINKNDLIFKYKSNPSHIKLIKILRKYLFDDLISIILSYFAIKFEKTINIGYNNYIQDKKNKDEISINHYSRKRNQYFMDCDFIQYKDLTYNLNNNSFSNPKIYNLRIPRNFTFSFPKKIIRCDNILNIIFRNHIYSVKDDGVIDYIFYYPEKIFTCKKYKHTFYFSKGLYIYSFDILHNFIFYVMNNKFDTFCIHDDYMYVTNFFCHQKEIIIIDIPKQMVEKIINLNQIKIYNNFQFLIATNKYYIFIYNKAAIYLIDYNGKLIQTIITSSDIISTNNDESYYLDNSLPDIDDDTVRDMIVDNEKIYLHIGSHIYIYS